MAPNTSDIERAVARTLRDSLEKLQHTSEEVNQAVGDLVSACASARPSNALPHLVRAQTAAASLAASLDVLSRFITGALQPGWNTGYEPARLSQNPETENDRIDGEPFTPIPSATAVPAVPARTAAQVKEPGAPEELNSSEKQTQEEMSPEIPVVESKEIAVDEGAAKWEDLSAEIPEPAHEIVQPAPQYSDATAETPAAPVEIAEPSLEIVEPAAELSHAVADLRQPSAEIPEPAAEEVAETLQTVAAETEAAENPAINARVTENRAVAEVATPSFAIPATPFSIPVAPAQPPPQPEHQIFDVAALPPEQQELHRRANRVAKVTMQDIKMLRPRDVELGKQNHDLCTRLRDDIERAHKEYERRFHAILDHPVDYFHAWMVEILADGKSGNLGQYPYRSPVLHQ